MTDEAVGQPQTPYARKRDNRNLPGDTTQGNVLPRADNPDRDLYPDTLLKAYRGGGTRLEEQGEEVGSLSFSAS